jgi:hypothetical protein
MVDVLGIEKESEKERERERRRRRRRRMLFRKIKITFKNHN